MLYKIFHILQKQKQIEVVNFFLVKFSRFFKRYFFGFVNIQNAPKMAMVYSKPNFCHFWVIWAKKLPTSHFWFNWFIEANFKPIQILKKSDFFLRGSELENFCKIACTRVRAHYITFQFFFIFQKWHF